MGKLEEEIDRSMTREGLIELDKALVWANAGQGKSRIAAEIAASQGLKYTVIDAVPNTALPVWLRGQYRARKPWEKKGFPAALNFQRLMLYLDILAEIEPCALQFMRKLKAQKKAQFAGFPKLVRELAKDLKLIAYHLRRVGRL